MRLLTYRRDGAVRHGHLISDTIHELGEGDLAELIAEVGDFSGWTPPPSTATYPLADVDVLPPLSRPGKLLAVAANYQDHVAEGGGDPLNKARLAPRLFLKPPTTLAAPGAEIELPSISTQIDWEAELAVVVGSGGKDIDVAAALTHVAGYAVANDVSARSVEYGYERDSAPVVGFFDWLAGKWPDGFCPFGPWLVTAPDVPDPQDLAVELAVNGVTRQSGTTADMIFDVAELVSFASRLMTLEPGDVLLTGTPAGTGAATGEFLRRGDEMTVRITGLGELVNRVV